MLVDYLSTGGEFLHAALQMATTVKHKCSEPGANCGFTCASSRRCHLKFSSFVAFSSSNFLPFSLGGFLTSHTHTRRISFDACEYAAYVCVVCTWRPTHSFKRSSIHVRAAPAYMHACVCLGTQIESNLTPSPWNGEPLNRWTMHFFVPKTPYWHEAFSIYAVKD